MCECPASETNLAPGISSAARLAASCISSASPTQMRHGTRHFHGGPPRSALRRGSIATRPRAPLARSSPASTSARAPGSGSRAPTRRRRRSPSCLPRWRRRSQRRPPLRWVTRGSTRTVDCRRGRARARAAARARRARSRAWLPMRSRGNAHARCRALLGPRRCRRHASEARRRSDPVACRFRPDRDDQRRSAGTRRATRAQGATPSRPRADRRSRCRRGRAGLSLPSPRSRCGRRREGSSRTARASSLAAAPYTGTREQQRSSRSCQLCPWIICGNDASSPAPVRGNDP